MSGFHFAVQRMGVAWRWALVDTPDEERATVVAVSPTNFDSREEVYVAIGLVRVAARLAGITIEVDQTNLPTVTVTPKLAAPPESRWRGIDSTGSVGGLSQDPPDTESDEGETGPPEVRL